MRATGRIRSMTWLGLLAAAGVSGCAHDGARARPRVTPYTAARPVDEAPGGKTFVLGGYAGYNYGPGPIVRPGRAGGNAVAPEPAL